MSESYVDSLRERALLFGYATRSWPVAVKLGYSERSKLDMEARLLRLGPACRVPSQDEIEALARLHVSHFIGPLGEQIEVIPVDFDEHLEWVPEKPPEQAAPLPLTPPEERDYMSRW